MKHETLDRASILRQDIRSMLEKGIRYHKNGQAESAKLVYERILTIDDKVPDALHLLALLEHKAGDWQKAKTLMAKAISLDPQEPIFYNNFGNLLKDEGAHDRAENCYRRAVAIKPDYSDACHNLAVLLQRRGDLKEAAVWVEKERDLGRDDFEVYFMLGNLYFSLHAYDKSADCYRRALAKDGQCADVYFQLGLIAFKSQDMQGAADYYRKVVEINPDMAEAWNNLGLVLKSQQQVAEAMNCFKKAIETMPAFPDAVYNLGNIYTLQEQPDLAKRCYRKAIDLDPSVSAPFARLGELFDKEGDWEQAFESYEQALHLNPASAVLYNAIGKLYQSRKNFQKAKPFFQKAIDLKIDYAEAIFNLAVVEGELGERTRAIDLYQRVLAVKPDSKETFYNLAGQLASLKRRDEAIRAAKQGIELDATYAEAHSNLGNYLRAAGRVEEAIHHFKKAIALEPELAHPHLNLALAYLVKGDFEDGWSEYDWRFQVDAYKADYRYIDKPLWDGKTFKDKTLLVYDEQGLGDTFQFVRYLPLVKRLGGRIVFETRRAIIPLIRGFDGIDELIERPDRGQSQVSYDMVIPLMSIPGKLGTTLQTIPAPVPYIRSLRAQTARWKERVRGVGIKVGMVWAGSKVHVNDANRTLGLEQLAWLSDIQGISLYSLQKEISTDEERQLLQLGIINLGKDFEDFTDTAAVIDEMDLVISVDTSVVHLAGAMGKPTWVLIPFDPDWRWMLSTSASPWYPSLTLFRQPNPDDWTAVMDALKDKVQSLLPRREHLIA